MSLYVCVCVCFFFGNVENAFLILMTLIHQRVDSAKYKERLVNLPVT
jgi:hypothetical protein